MTGELDALREARLTILAHYDPQLGDPRIRPSVVRAQVREIDRLLGQPPTEFPLAPSTEPTGEGRHPDDGHEHWFACIRCGVDNGLNEVADSRQSEGLQEAALRTIAHIVGPQSTGTHSCWATAKLGSVRLALAVAAPKEEPHE